MTDPHPRLEAGPPRKSALVLMAAAALLVSACSSGASERDEAAPRTTPDTEKYAVADREQFLASDPDCGSLEAWYEHNPRDEHMPTVRRHLEKCGSLPDVAANNGKVMLELRSEIFEATDAGSKTRTRLHQALAAETCFNFQNGELSPYDVALDVDNAGGFASDTNAVIAAAAGLCPEYADDLTVFESDDLLAAAGALESFVADEWPGALAGGAEQLGMAHMVCKEGTDPVDADMTDMFIEAGLAEGAADEFREYVRNNLCG